MRRADEWDGPNIFAACENLSACRVGLGRWRSTHGARDGSEWRDREGNWCGVRLERRQGETLHQEVRPCLEYAAQGSFRAFRAMNALFAISVIVIYAAKAILRTVHISGARQGRHRLDGDYRLCRPTYQLCWEV